jgi:hypothetical protein
MVGGMCDKKFEVYFSAYENKKEIVKKYEFSRNELLKKY